MIVANNESHIENNVGSKTQQFGIEISPLLYKLMYSSMYEDKEQVVLQELSANALDAHKAAGKEHIPISITLPSQLSPELVVQDFGVGMSYETISSIYPSYGKSTKSHDNELTGGFGYGSKSPFALTDAFTVVTTHKGITTKVACFLDGGVPNFTIFNSVETGEEDGTTVRVPISSEQVQKTIEKKVSYLFWLWPVPPNVSAKEDTYFVDFNKEYSLYSTPLYEVYKDNVRKFLPGYNGWSNTIEPRVGVGAFTYKIPTNMRNRLTDCAAYALFAKNDSGMGEFLVVPKFQIGELELSPSREVIEDTPENMAVIEERYQTIFKQVKTTCKKPMFDVYKELVDLLYSDGVWLRDIVKTAPKNFLITIDKQILTDYLAEVLDNADNPLTKSYFAYTVWNDLSLLAEGSDQYSTLEIIDLFHKTEELGSYFCKWSRGATQVFASIEGDLINAGLLEHYGKRLKVLDFSALVNHTKDNIASYVFSGAPGERPNESFIYPRGAVGHRTAYFNKSFTEQTHVLLKGDLPSRIVNYTIRSLSENSSGDEIISLDSFNEKYYKPAFDWCIKNLDWKITYHSKDTLETNWANKPKVTRTSSAVGTQNKTKVNETIIAQMWKDGSFVDVSRAEFQTSLAVKDDYVWIVKDKTDAVKLKSLLSLMEKVPSHVQKKVKLFCIPSKYYGNKSVTTVLKEWSNYEVFSCSSAKNLYHNHNTDILKKWPLYKAHETALKTQAAIVGIFDDGECSVNTHEVVQKLFPSVITHDYADLRLKHEYHEMRRRKEKVCQALEPTLLGRFLALRYYFVKALDPKPALAQLTVKDKSVLLKLLQQLTQTED